MRNPKWTRDELIVALDFYLRHTPALPRKNSKELSELSTFLNDLQTKMDGVRPEKFRNINGTYMKLMNFLRLDPEYPGKGLQRGNKEEAVVWNLYYSNRTELQRVASAIRSFVSSEESHFTQTDPDNYEGQEGRLLTRVHQFRERNRKLVARKKQAVLKKGEALVCEVCDFDFGVAYGERGQGFIECHHNKPLSELSPHGQTTKIADLSLLCSNCHRMIHRNRPWLTIEELQALV